MPHIIIVANMVFDWSPRPSTSPPLTHISFFTSAIGQYVFTVVNKHYICGGQAGGSYFDACHTYKIGESTQSLVPSAVLPMALSFGSTVVLGRQKVWLVGGRSASGTSGLADVSLIFDPRSESWTTDGAPVR